MKYKINTKYRFSWIDGDSKYSGIFHCKNIAGDSLEGDFYYDDGEFSKNSRVDIKTDTKNFNLILEEIHERTERCIWY